jgi:hypothetical protein
MGYIWNTQEVEVYNVYGDHNDVIFKANYSITKTDDDGNAETLFRQATFDLSDLSGFVAFDDLTSETVLNWIKSDLGSDGVSALETESDQALSNMLNISTKQLNG